MKPWEMPCLVNLQAVHAFLEDIHAELPGKHPDDDLPHGHAPGKQALNSDTANFLAQ